MLSRFGRLSALCARYQRGRRSEAKHAIYDGRIGPLEIYETTEKEATLFGEEVLCTVARGAQLLLPFRLIGSRDPLTSHPCARFQARHSVGGSCDRAVSGMTIKPKGEDDDEVAFKSYW